MLNCILPFLAAAPAFAQFETLPGAQMGIVRGHLIAWSRAGASGEMEIRDDSHSIRCRFDLQTNFEHERFALTASALTTGAQIEIVADRTPGPVACYARTVDLDASLSDELLPPGHVHLGGLVVHREGRKITLRTRSGEVQLNLRPATRYLENGTRIASPGLVNRHVFIHASPGARGALEADLVAWGNIAGGD